jgi:hypothetical protein
MNIKFETRGNTYFRHESSIAYEIDGQEYWFTLIEEGDSDNAPNGNNFYFESDEELPFELSEEMEEEMYCLAWQNPTN